MASLSRTLFGASRFQCGRCVTAGAASARARPIQARSLASTASRWAEVRPGPALSQTNREWLPVQLSCPRRLSPNASKLTAQGAEATLRRFWKTVNIKEEDGGSVVTLDHRNLRTPGGKKLVIPADKRLLAALIAHEWDIQEEVLKQHALPLVSCVPPSRPKRRRCKSAERDRRRWHLARWTACRMKRSDRG